MIQDANDTHEARNNSLHTNDARLRADGKKLVKRGYTTMCKEDHPYMCAIAENVDWILENLC